MTEPDEVEIIVSDLITAILGGTEEQVASTFQRLAKLNAAEVLGELFLWVEDVTDEQDIDELISVARLPIPTNTKEIVAAIRARNMKALESVTSENDFTFLVQAVLQVIVTLKDARTLP